MYKEKILIREEMQYLEHYYFFSKLAAQFQSMEVRNSNFAAFIDVFTSNTYVMVIMSDPTIRKYLKFIYCIFKNLLFKILLKYTYFCSIRGNINQYT